MQLTALANQQHLSLLNRHETHDGSECCFAVPERQSPFAHDRNSQT